MAEQLARALLLGDLQAHGAGTVAKKDGRVSALGREPERRGLTLAADEQDAVVRPHPDVAVGGREAVEESCALVANVHGAHLSQAERVLEQDAVAGEEVIRCEGREDDELDVVRRPARVGHGGFGRGGRHVGACLTIGGEPTLLDPRALLNPRVRGIHQLLELVVGHDPRREVVTQPCNACAARHDLSCAKKSLPLSSTRMNAGKSFTSIR